MIMSSREDQILDTIQENLKVWYDPNAKVFYKGPTGHPDISDFVAAKGTKAQRGERRFVEVGEKYLAAAERSIRAGGIFDTSHSSAIKAVVVLDRVLGVSFRQFRIAEMFEIVNAPELVLSGDVGTVYAASTRVLPLEESKILNQTYARTTWDLAATGKNVVHLLLSDEAGKQAVHDVNRLQIDNASKALAKAENTQLATIVEGHTAAAKGDWGAMTTNADFNNRNPLDDLQDILTTIWDNGFEPDTMGVHPRPFADFMSNTFVHNTKIDAALKQDGGVLQLTGFPTLKIIVDAALTNTKGTIVSKSEHGLLVRGPTEAAQYRDEIRGGDGYVIRQWTEAKRLVAGAGRTMTSVSA